MFNKQKVSILLLGLIIVIGSILYCFRNTDIKLTEKTPVEIILSEKPKSNHFKTSVKFYDDIKIKAKGYTGSFIIENFEYKASNYTDITNRLEEGDTVTLWIDKSGEGENNIIVYQLRFKNIDYINIQERNKIKSRYNKYGLIVTLYGLFLIANLYWKKGYSLTFKNAILILFIIVIGIYQITK